MRAFIAGLLTLSTLFGPSASVPVKKAILTPQTTSTWPVWGTAKELVDVNFAPDLSAHPIRYYGDLVDDPGGLMDNTTITLRVVWAFDISHNCVGGASSGCAAACVTPSTGEYCLAAGTLATDHPADFTVTWYVGGVACSSALNASTEYSFDLDITNSCLDTLDDGFYAVEPKVLGGTNHPFQEITYQAALLHLYRGSPHAYSDMVPMVPASREASTYLSNGLNQVAAPGTSRVPYIDVTTLTPKAHPRRADVMGVPWSGNPAAADLWQDEMAPHTDQFTSVPFIYALDSRYPDAGRKYIYYLPPKFDEAHDGLYHGVGGPPYTQQPYKDGPAGIAWVSAFGTGFVRAGGDHALYFVEPGGVIREMSRDGTVETLFGWHTPEDGTPYRWLWDGDITPEATDRIFRESQVQAGCWSGAGERSFPYNNSIHTPLDIAPWPGDDDKFVVTGWGDNNIYMLEEGACVGGGHDGEAQLSILAGQTDHTSGDLDGVGTAAKLHGPVSITFVSGCSCWYFTDELNDKIKRLDTNGTVTTVEGIGNTIDRLNDDFTLTGNVTTTAGSATVTCATTCAFTTELATNVDLTIGGELKRVATVVDNTSFTVVTWCAACGYTNPYDATHTNVAATREGIVFGQQPYSDTFIARQRGAKALEDLNVSGANKLFTIDSTQALAGKRAEIWRPMAIRALSNGKLAMLEHGTGSIRVFDPATHVVYWLDDANPRMDSETQGFGWTWLDVDVTGNSGEQDRVWWTVFQGSTCRGDVAIYDIHTNEEYCTIASDGLENGGKFLFRYDNHANPDGSGPITGTDPPHYGWMISIDPEGGVYLSGGGEHGITRLRVRQSFDQDKTAWPDYLSNPLHYQDARKYWLNGGCETCTSLLQRFGSEGHNYIGLEDLWDHRPDESDADLIAAFDIQEAKIDAEDPTLHAKKILLAFMRFNMGPPPENETHDTPDAQKAPLRLRIHGEPDHNKPDSNKGGRK